MSANVAQFIQLLNRIAPPRLAESWDNVGLQVGSPNWPVKKVWTALDPLPHVVESACENHVDLLITHHPLFFKPIKRIDGDSALGRITEMALSRRLSIVAAHTNLDSVAGGVNDALAQRMGLNHTRVLSGPADADQVKLVVFVPTTDLNKVLDALFEINAGHIDSYSCCTFRCEGVGTFLPGEDAKPAVGQRGKVNEVRENRIEIITPRSDVDRLIDAVKKAHPYESVPCDVYPLIGNDLKAGLGRLADLASPLSLKAFAAHLKRVLNLSVVKVAGDAKMKLETVALCSGSGASLMPAGISSGAQAYISGDLGYHTARDAEQAGIALIDIGHFGSEHLIVEVLAAFLRQATMAAGISATVEPCGIETDPFHYL